MRSQLSTDLDQAHGTEVNFSLSRRTPSMVTQLEIEGRSESIVYLFFYPVPPPGGVSHDDVHEQAVEVYISCKSLRDCHRVIRLIARCRLPELKVLCHELTFAGRLSSERVGASTPMPVPPHIRTSALTPSSLLEARSIDFGPDQSFELTNLHPDANLDFAIYNDSMFFVVTPHRGTCRPQETITIRVSPSHESITMYSDLVFKVQLSITRSQSLSHFVSLSLLLSGSLRRRACHSVQRQANE